MFRAGLLGLFLLCISAVAQEIAQEIAQEEEEHVCEKKTPMKAELRYKVFCNYDSYERPVMDHLVVTNVSLQISLKNIEYNEYSSALAVNFWATIIWMDRLLDWKPEEHNNIKSLVVRYYSLWNPELSVYNRLEQTETATIFNTEHCVVKYNGQISSVSPNNHEILCQPNLKYFPFDKQICTMTIGSSIYGSDEVNLMPAKLPVTLSDYIDLGEWKLNSVNVTIVSVEHDCCPNTTFPSLQYTFHIERHSGIHVCFAIVPAITMFVMTFVSFSMEIRGQERTMTVVSNIIIHMLYVQFYAWLLPFSGPEPPLIMTFTRDSLILTTFLLLLNTILRKLIQCKMESPRLLATATGFAMNNRAVQLIFMFDGSLKEVAERLGDDDGRNIVENVQTTSSVNTDWLVIAKLLDRLALILYLIVYSILSIACIP